MVPKISLVTARSRFAALCMETQFQGQCVVVNLENQLLEEEKYNLPHVIDVNYEHVQSAVKLCCCIDSECSDYNMEMLGFQVNDIIL